MTKTVFIGSASGWGAQVRGTEKGPQMFQNSDFLASFPFLWTWKETLFPLKTAEEITLPPGVLTLPYIEDICLRIANSVEETIKRDERPVVIGGDHVVAVGTWAGVTYGLEAKEKFGLIWVDAHMDAHTMETTPSQAYHGMPLAVLLGHGEPSLVNLLDKGAVLRPEHVCLIGVRSYEEGEETLLKRLGVRIFFMEEVEERGFEAVFKEALTIVKTNTNGYGLSIDLDAFDPMEAPGVGTPAPQGLKQRDVLPSLVQIQSDLALKAFEIVEYNPDRDKNDKTLYLMRDILLNLLSAKGE
ncbi:MAG: arginase [Alphaproteobacteria bacterium]|nr:arginase [Alphaproteobacteria bacterium]